MCVSVAEEGVGPECRGRESGCLGEVGGVGRAGVHFQIDTNNLKAVTPSRLLVVILKYSWSLMRGRLRENSIVLYIEIQDCWTIVNAGYYESLIRRFPCRVASEIEVYRKSLPRKCDSRLESIEVSTFKTNGYISKLWTTGSLHVFGAEVHSASLLWPSPGEGTFSPLPCVY